MIYDDDVLLQFLVLMGELFGGGGDSTLDFLVVSSSGINSLEINDNLVNFLDFRKEKMVVFYGPLALNDFYLTLV